MSRFALVAAAAASCVANGNANALATGHSMEALGGSWATYAQRSESSMEAAVEEMQQQFLQTVFPFPELLEELRRAQMAAGEPMPMLRLDSSKLSLLAGDSPTELADWWTHLPRNLTFIHIARTGGTAVESVRYNYERKRQGLDKPHTEDVNPPMWGVNDLRQHGNGELGGKKVFNSFRDWKPDVPFNAHCYKQHHPTNMNPAAFVNSDTFCVVRDPVAKAISQFGFANAFYGKPMAPDCTPESMNAYFNQTFSMLPENPYIQDCHWVPQAAYVYNWDNATLKVDYDHGRQCKHVLRNSHMTGDFNVLMEKYGYPFRFDEKKRSGFSSSKGCGALKPDQVEPQHVEFIKKHFAEDSKLIEIIDKEYEDLEKPPLMLLETAASRPISRHLRKA